MSFKVVIPTAGIGSRLQGYTKYINKSLVGIANRPTISHLIELFPPDCEFVIALGHKGNLVRDFLELAYPKTVFHFSDVPIFEGKKSGLGLSLLSCEQYLQEPFVFLSCDTLIKGNIPIPDHNWIGYAERAELKQYRTINVVNKNATMIFEKGREEEDLKAYIGLAGIYDYQNFWYAMHSGDDQAIVQGESYGINSILNSRNVSAYEFTWFDTGNIDSMQAARKEYSQLNEPNILEKDNEAIWFVGRNVIKFSDDIDFISNRVRRVNDLKGFVPEIDSYRSNMYCYRKIDGEILSDVVNLEIFENFLKKCQYFWLEKDLNKESRDKFKKNCLHFYKDKTFERVEMFYSNFNKKDNCQFINGDQIPKLSQLLNQIDWEWMSDGLAGRFHGDFHFENILYLKNTNDFKFLDWRQDFSGDLSIGDIYYDLAKLLHGIIVNHGIISKNEFRAIWKDNEIKFDLARKPNLVECEDRFILWIKQNGYDLKKVRVLTALIYLNIAALHHFPYSILLYGLGKSLLYNELKK